MQLSATNYTPDPTLGNEDKHALHRHGIKCVAARLSVLSLTVCISPAPVSCKHVGALFRLIVNAAAEIPNTLPNTKDLEVRVSKPNNTRDRILKKEQCR